MDLLEFLGYELPKSLNDDIDLSKTQRYYNDLDRAIDGAQKACGYSEDEQLIEEVDSIDSERSWAGDHIHALIEAYSNQESQIYELESLVSYLTDEIQSRMTEEEIKNYEQAIILAKLKAKESP